MKKRKNDRSIRDDEDGLSLKISSFPSPRIFISSRHRREKKRRWCAEEKEAILLLLLNENASSSPLRWVCVAHLTETHRTAAAACSERETRRKLSADTNLFSFLLSFSSSPIYLCLTIKQETFGTADELKSSRSDHFSLSLSLWLLRLLLFLFLLLLLLLLLLRLLLQATLRTKDAGEERHVFIINTHLLKSTMLKDYNDITPDDEDDVEEDDNRLNVQS